MSVMEMLFFVMCFANICLSAKLLVIAKASMRNDTPPAHLPARCRAEIISVRPVQKPDAKALFRKACEGVAREYGLTVRETDVCVCLAKGKSTVSAAESLNLSNATVKSHANNIYRKLGIHTRDQLIDLVELQLAS